MMKYFFKKAVLLLLSLSLVCALLPTAGSAATIGGVQAALNEVMADFPVGSYFTTDGKPGSPSDLISILRARGLNTTGYDMSGTCVGFAKYVWAKVFGHNITRGRREVGSGGRAGVASTWADAKIGDLAYFYAHDDLQVHAGESIHIAVILDVTDSSVTLYDANFANDNRISIYTVSFGGWGWPRSYCRIFRSTNYDSVDSRSVDIELASVPDGLYTLSPKCAPGKNLDVQDRSTSSAANIQIWEPNQDTNQQFQFSLQKDGYYTITAKNSGCLLDVAGAKTTPGTNIQQYTANGSDAQEWALVEAGKGYYYIVSKLNPALCLDVSEARTKNGTNVQLWTSNQTTAQKWKLTPVDSASDAKVCSVTFNANGGTVSTSTKTVTAGSTYGTLPTPTRSGYTFAGWYTKSSGGSKVTASTVVTLKSSHTLYAHWKQSGSKITFQSLTTPGDLTVGSSGFIGGSITSSNSPICSVSAAVYNASTGKSVLTAKSSGFAVSTYGPLKNSKIDADLRFDRLPAGTYYISYTVKTEDGTTATEKTSTFKVTDSAPPATVSNGLYTLSPKCAPDKYLDVQDRSKKDSANIQIWEANGDTNQQFKLTAIGDGYYTITSKKSGKLVDVAGGKGVDGTNIQQYASNDSDAQKWMLVDAGGGYYYIVSKIDPSLCLDVFEARANNGTNVQLWTLNRTDAQKWKLTPIK